MDELLRDELKQRALLDQLEAGRVQMREINGLISGILADQYNSLINSGIPSAVAGQIILHMVATRYYPPANPFESFFKKDKP